MDQPPLSQHQGIKSVCGPFTASRAWAYWVVTGPVSVEAARELYAHPLGRTVVRVGGVAGNMDPDEWLRKHPYTTTVDTYHIDTDEGWLLFTRTLRKHGLT